MLCQRTLGIAIWMFIALPVRAEVCFDDGGKVNLAAVRGAKVSACKTCTTAADLACRPVHTTEMRFQSNYGRAWWMIELPQPCGFPATASGIAIP